MRELEAELRRLSDEVATDALTQVANRRGLDAGLRGRVRARATRDAARRWPSGLIDIDNFKKLNDTPRPRRRRPGAEGAGRRGARAAAAGGPRGALRRRGVRACCCRARRSTRRSRR
ncbi:MAG: GGDEF domain-containing protein [Comamonadaceae bacterium]|nr:GGDEF domain-containing protein [Comamonadaceae bacterium]